MVVDVGLGVPLPVQDPGDHLGLDLAEVDGVPVVVVARVLVVEEWGSQTLVLGIQVLVVPVRDYDLAVGVEAGEEEEHRVVPHVLVLGAGRHLVGELGGHLGPAHLRRVDAHGHGDDCPAVADDPLQLLLCEPLWMGEAPAHVPDRVDPLHVFLR